MKLMTRGTACISAAFLICTLPGCAPTETGWKGRTENRDGVTVVYNPKEPVYSGPVLELEEELTIGSGETGEERMFQDIRSLDVDSEGNIFVLDEGAADVKVFSRKGEYLRTIGRKGEGPGEFAFPILVLVTPKSELLVHDMNQRSLKILDRDGSFLRQLSIADKFQFSGPRFISGEKMVASYLVPAQQPLAELVLFDSALTPIHTIVSQPLEPPPVLHYFAGNSMTGLRWNIKGSDEVVWGDFLESDYIFHVHNAQGKHIRSIERTYDAIRITEAAKDPLLHKMFGDNPPPPPWDIRIPGRYPPFSGISCDDSGRIFIKTYARVGQQVTEVYDVFDEDGRYMAQITLPVPLMVLRQDILYSIVENEDGFPEVRRYKLTWSQKI